jgi:hypothetical protein
MKWFKLFALIYVIVVGFIYGMTKRSGIPKLFPGDIFIQKSGRTIYAPTGAALMISGLIFLILYSVLT